MEVEKLEYPVSFFVYFLSKNQMSKNHKLNVQSKWINIINKKKLIIHLLKLTGLN